MHLRAERDAVAGALEALERQAPKDDPRLKALTAYSEEINAALTKLIPCGGPEILAMVMPLYDQAKEAIKAGGSSVSLPVGVQISRTGNMGKSEQGWYFNALAVGFNGADMLTSRPVAYVPPPSKVPGLLSTASASTEGERTLVGTIHRRITDSCFAVTAGGDEKCYGLPGEPAQARRIYSVCNDGDTCSITGQFDDKAESLGTFSKVEKTLQ